MNKKINFEFSLDDGTIEDLKLIPILIKYKIPTIFYITINRVNKNGFLNWDQIKDIEKEELFSIQCHSYTHPMDQKRLYDEDLFLEIEQSKGMLESVLNKKITNYCHPRGRYDQRITEKLINSGYTEARTTIVGNIFEQINKFNKDTTCHVFQRKEYGTLEWLDYAKNKIDSAIEHINNDCKDIKLRYWGHSKEIIRDNNVEKLEDFFKYIKNKI